MRRDLSNNVLQSPIDPELYLTLEAIAVRAETMHSSVCTLL